MIGSLDLSERYHTIDIASTKALLTDWCAGDLLGPFPTSSSLSSFFSSSSSELLALTVTDFEALV